jgi:hypothetical protein
MTTSRTRRVLGALVTAVLTLAVVGPAGAAPNQYATSIGTATSNPLSGSVTVAPIVVTSRLCPASTTAINAFLDSAAAGLAEAVAISSNQTDIPFIATNGISLSNSLVDIAASQGRTLVNGRYELSVVCYPDLFGTPPTGQFDGVITVSGGATPTSQGTTYTFTPGGNITATSTTLVADPTGQGQLATGVTLTATVSPATAGTVQFVDVPPGGAGANIGAPQPVDAATGRATLALGSLTPPPAAGARVFRAVFTPADPTKFAPSTSADLVYQIVGEGQKATVTTLTAAPAVSVTKGNPLTLTATVAFASAETPGPAGTVRFLDGAVSLGAAEVVSGGAALTLRPSTAGTLALRAVFTPTDTAGIAGSTSADLTYIVSEPKSEGEFLGLLTVTSPNGAGKEDQGKATDRLQLKSEDSQCPNGSSAVTMRISGPGAWAPGFAIGSSGFFDRPGTNVPTDQTIADVAGLNGLKIVPGLYLIAATCRISTIDPTATGFFVGQVWFYDDTNWLNQNPKIVGIPTVVSLQITPADRAEITAKVTLVATVSPADAPGKIAFSAASDAGTTDVEPVVIKNGKATATVTTLTGGLYYVTATYQPDGKTHNASTSPEIVYAITKAVPPRALGPATVAGTPRVGATLTCRSSFRNAKGTTYLWLRDGAPIGAATKVGYTPVRADAGRLLACRALATNAGGTVYRTSAAVRVSG